MTTITTVRDGPTLTGAENASSRTVTTWTGSPMYSNRRGSEAEELAERWFDDLLTRGDLSVADEIVAEDVTYHGPKSLAPDDVNGPNDLKEYVELYLSASRTACTPLSDGSRRVAASRWNGRSRGHTGATCSASSQPAR